MTNPMTIHQSARSSLYLLQLTPDQKGLTIAEVPVRSIYVKPSRFAAFRDSAMTLHS